MGKGTQTKLPQAIDNTTTDDNQLESRDWNGRPIDEPVWYYANLKALYDEVDDSRLFVEKGIVPSEKGSISVNSVNHVIALKFWRVE